ncbi:ABC transporter permease [Pseudidiomarina homiensis]|uniref:Cell division protein FtsX n=1 Tax=Pseudidiomarina homiensis TaxID=364198 RepID=A0A432XUE1_9GAMM|nr:FtsX-like permease family protein [Pseudidiomarina homiensis]RUO52273.1 cell division protein FtsX [Pseudidiomarina homiensis]
MNQIGPIFRALLRNKVGALLLALQIALTMTIIVNAIHMIENRSSMMARESGMDEANQFHLMYVGYKDSFNERVAVETDLLEIRKLNGVVDATQINSTPLSGGGWSMGLTTTPNSQDGTPVSLYFVDDHGLNTLGVELVAGENFSQTEVTYRLSNDKQWPQNILLTEAAAKNLFPDLTPAEMIGQTVFIRDDEPMTIKGIIDHLQAPWVQWSNVNNVMLVPQRGLWNANRYLVRTAPGERDRLMREVEELLLAKRDGRLIRNVTAMDEQRDDAYQDFFALQTVLWVIVTVLTLVTALGIVGMVSFTVNQRRKQIGTRRALGATKGDIMRQFMLENLLITGSGLIIGVASSIALNIWLVDTFSLPRIGWHYLPIAMVVLVIVGQLAVLGPARKAANLSPALATRTT